MPKNYTTIELQGEQVAVCRLFKNDRCVLGQTRDGRYVVYTMEDKEYHVFDTYEGYELNKFLIEKHLVGSILYMGRREGYNVALVELPDRGYVLTVDDQMEHYYDSDDEKQYLTDTLIGVLGFCPNNPADCKTLEHLGYYFEENL